MADSYLGEIRLFAGNFAPNGWMFCDGSILSINQNETLFQLIGTSYGGNGQSSFALPDLRGRVPIHQGQGPDLPSYSIAEQGGVEAVALTTAQMPAHRHLLRASTAAAAVGTPAGAVLAATSGNSYGPNPADTVMAAGAITAVQGGSQPHDNMAPYSVLNYIICLEGIFPSQN